MFTSQYTRTMRNHIGYESAQQRDRRRAKREIHAYLDQCAAMRARLAESRVLPMVPDPVPARAPAPVH